MKQVVICGGGFAGVRLARKLKRVKDINVTLINHSADFRYYPAMYRAATGFKLGSARLPLEWILLDVPHTDLFIDTVNGVDTKKKQIHTVGGLKVDYDYAVFALGSVTTYFNIEGVHEHSFGMKSPEEIVQLRDHLHSHVTSGHQEDQNYVIVGAGPTGIELAGSFGVYVKHITKKHKLKKHPVKIWVVEAAPRILPSLSERTSKKVARRLEKLGVKILTNTAVTKETVHRLVTSQGSIKTHTVVWTAGTANNPFFAEHPKTFELNNRGRVIVNDHLMTRDHLYVIGDNAATPHGGLALTAIQHANFVARDIKARMKRKPRPQGYENSPISVIPVDSNWSVLEYKKIVMSGWLIAQVRRAADYMGYADLLGPYKAFSIWTSSDNKENACTVCNKNS